MELKNGSKGAEVKQLQTLLGVKVDGDFGTITETAVKKWQAENSLTANGIVDAITLAKMQPRSTDTTERFFPTNEGLSIETHFLHKGEYFAGPTKKEFLFLHHTAGSHDPYNVISAWERDNHTIATEFVMGGQSIKGNSDEYDGKVIQAFPNGAYAWHLGDNGSQYMHEHSVGIEVCNFGYLEEGGYHKWDPVNRRKVWVAKTPGKLYTYVGTEAAESQAVKLAEPFRGYQHWHRYSDEQIENLRRFILFIADRDSIDVRAGLIQEVKKYGAKGFDFNDDAYNGKRRGMWTHTNTRKDKTDMFPQRELLDMLVAL